MQDLFPIPSCFSPSPTSETPTTTKLGQSIATSTYRTTISNLPHLITITWCKNLLTLSLYLSIQLDNSNNIIPSTSIKVHMRPWRGRHGSKRCPMNNFIPNDDDNNNNLHLDLFWDLKSAKFSSDSSSVDHPEPLSNYYLALVFQHEIILLLGDLNHDAFLTTRSRPSISDPVLVSKKEHVFGKRRFVTRAKFEEKGRFHEVAIESRSDEDEDEMVIKIDGCVGIEVRHLGWKFRGHESVRVSKTVRVEVYWDVHDWLFSSGSGGLRHAIFIFKPVAPPVLSLSSSSSSLTSSCSLNSSGSTGGTTDLTASSSDFCLFLYAWKLD